MFLSQPGSAMLPSYHCLQTPKNARHGQLIANRLRPTREHASDESVGGYSAGRQRRMMQLIEISSVQENSVGWGRW